MRQLIHPENQNKKNGDKMRVIAGKARRLNLKTIEGLDTRPTTDRIKETLFNMINDDVRDAVFVDLFSGSGGIGIEALSRGAKHAYFVENNKNAVKCIKENLVFTKLIENSTIMGDDVFAALNKLNANVIADIIYMDPPYSKEFEKEVLTRLSQLSIANDETIIIVEAALDTNFDYTFELGYDIIKEKIYKTNKHIFLRKSK